LHENDINIYIISLKERKDRRLRIDMALKILNLKFEYSSGIRVLNKRGLEEYFTPAAKQYLTSGSIGCILAHVRCYHKFLRSGKQHCLIFEDDVQISAHFKEELRIVLSKIPRGFDILYLGSRNKFDYRYWVCSNFYAPKFPRKGNYAYLLSKEGALRILKAIFPITITAGGIDSVLGRFISNLTLTAYHVYPPICKVDLIISSDVYNPSNPKKTVNGHLN
jgi:GR25 family glycosyltransferase involved in LPS biosynthesis